MRVFEGVILITVGLACLFFNRHIGEVCRGAQKSLWGLDYDLSSYRLPGYIIGIIFVILGLARFFDS